MSGSWEIFDKLARRHLADGLTDAETLEGTRKHMRALPATFWPAETETEALARIAELRLGMPPPRTEAEALAAFDSAIRGRSATGDKRSAAGRPRGRPPTSQATFWRKYREAVERAGPDATDVTLATGEVFMYADERQFQRLVDRHGRPPEYRAE